MDEGKTKNNWYIGELNHNNLPHGNGELTYIGNAAIYKGEFSNGIPNGFGKITFKSGVAYEGGFKDGKYSGSGKLIDNEEVILDGIWDKDTPIGDYTGVKIYQNGSTYVGEFDDTGEPYGKGRIIYPKGEKYVGDVATGLPHGKGIWTQRGGSTEECNWLNGKKQGEYTLNWSDGCRISKRKIHDSGSTSDNRYLCFVPEFISGMHKKVFYDGGYFDGEWKDGWFLKGKVRAVFNKRLESLHYDKEEGHTTIAGKIGAVASFLEGDLSCEQFCGDVVRVWPNGTKYEGQWRDDQQYGCGTIVYAIDDNLSGTSYAGEWNNGKYHGKGTLTRSNGDRYEGEFKEDKYHGRGTLYRHSGSKYEGEFKDGLYHGYGTVLYSTDGKLNGNSYEGEWKNGDWHGTGKYSNAKGTRYEGEVTNGKFHGQGILTRADGRRYEGNFKDDKFHGQGTFTYATGRYYVGEFVEGNFHGKGILYNADGSIAKDGLWQDDKFLE